MSDLRKVLPETGWTPSYWVVSQNADLSLNALGLHTYLMSLPDGWDISAERVARDRKEGRGSILKYMKELRKAGLLRTTTHQGPGGKISSTTRVCAVPGLLDGTHVEDEDTSQGDPNLTVCNREVKAQVAPESRNRTPDKTAGRTGVQETGVRWTGVRSTDIRKSELLREETPRRETEEERLQILPARNEHLATLGATADEEREILTEIATREPDVRNPTRFLAWLAQEGTLPVRLEAVRARQQREATQQLLQHARTADPCAHGLPGGNLPHPATGVPLCALCRHQNTTSELALTHGGTTP